jgi:hypothetical protein
MPRVGDRAALGIFIVLAGSTFVGLGMTSAARSNSKSKQGEQRAPGFDARLKALDK